MKLLVLVIAGFVLIETAHLAFHWDNCAKPQIFNKNF